MKEWIKGFLFGWSAAMAGTIIGMIIVRILGI